MAKTRVLRRVYGGREALEEFTWISSAHGSVLLTSYLGLDLPWTLLFKGQEMKVRWRLLRDCCQMEGAPV